MKSKAKVQLSDADIQRLVNHAFGNSVVFSIQELCDGWANSAYHVIIGEERKETVLKVGPPVGAPMMTYEKNALLAEVELMKIVAQHPDIPVPRIFFDDFSHTQIPHDYYFMDFVFGTPWNKVRDQLPERLNRNLERQLGRITSAINSFEHTAFGYYASERQFSAWPDAFRSMCEQLFTDARQYNIALDISEREFFQMFEQHSTIFTTVVRSQLVHWDLWEGNIFIRHDDNTADIVAFVDFERALWSEPLMEFYPSRLVNISEYIAGYGEDLLRTQAQRLRRIFYNMYLNLVMIIEDGPRQYEDKGSVMWARGQLLKDIAMLQQSDVLEHL